MTVRLVPTRMRPSIQLQRVIHAHCTAPSVQWALKLSGRTGTLEPPRRASSTGNLRHFLEVFWRPVTLTFDLWFFELKIGRLLPMGNIPINFGFSTSLCCWVKSPHETDGRTDGKDSYLGQLRQPMAKYDICYWDKNNSSNLNNSKARKFQPL